MADTAEYGVETALREEIESNSLKIKELRSALEPLEERQKILQRMLREYSKQNMTSKDKVSDEEVIAFLSRSTSAENRATAQQIAEHFGVDARGFSNRLPRMVRESLISGSAEEGYYAPARRGRKPAQ